jgi:hypothetical protein
MQNVYEKHKWKIKKSFILIKDKVTNNTIIIKW